MKITCRNARMDEKGLHNDRNFDISKAAHIDPTKTKDNIYWTYCFGENDVRTFEEVENQYYEDHFSRKIEEQNQRYKAYRRPDKCKTTKDYWQAKNTKPEDKILQIGDINEHPDPSVLWECALEFQARFEELYGSNCTILDMALHVDEATPHVHIRRVWHVEDENGVESVSQNKALEELGISLPDNSAPESKTNNRKMTISATETELFRQICLEHGLVIEKGNDNSREHLQTIAYKNQQETKRMEALESERIRLEAEINMLNQIIGLDYDYESREKAYKEELKRRDEKLKTRDEFLTANGLMDAYKIYANDKTGEYISANEQLNIR